jgi:hypothetical protein
MASTGSCPERKKHKFTGHQDLRAALVKEVNGETAILDLLLLNEEDQTQLQLLARKEELKRILASRSAHVLTSSIPVVMARLSIVLSASLTSKGTARPLSASNTWR